MNGIETPQSASGTHEAVSQPEQAILRQPGQPDKSVEILDHFPLERVTEEEIPADFMDRPHLLNVRVDNFETTVPSTDVVPIPSETRPAVQHEEQNPAQPVTGPENVRPEIREEKTEPQNIEVRRVEAGDADEETAPAQFEPESLTAVQEKISRAETQHEALADQLHDLKQRAASALEADDFKKTANLSENAAAIKVKLRNSDRRLKSLKRKETMLGDVLNQDRIAELEERILHELEAEKARRGRLQDRDSTDSYGEMLKRVHIAKYLEALSSKYPNLPSSVQLDIMAMIDAKKWSPKITVRDFRDRDVSRGNTDKEPPAAPDIDTLQPIPDGEKHFGPNQEVIFEENGRRMNGWKVIDYGRRSTGEIMVNVISHDRRSDKWVSQSDLLAMQAGGTAPPEQTDPAPMPAPAAAEDYPPAPVTTAVPAVSETMPAAGGAPYVPEVLPAAEPETPFVPSVVGAYDRMLGGEAGFWETIFKPVDTKAAELRGFTRDKIRRGGRWVIRGVLNRGNRTSN
jgi:hypothetical protein